MAIFTMDMLGLATRAYRRLGILPAGGVPSDDQFEQAVICYNSMATGQAADSPSLFRLTQVSLTVPTNVGYPGTPYVITPQIANFIDGRWLVTGGNNPYERPMGYFSYEDYMTLPNKRAPASSGPSVWCFDKQVTQSNLYLWPLPTFGGTLNATVARYANAVSEPTDPIDFPPEWMENLSYALADRLMDDEGVSAADPQTAQRIEQHALAFWAKLDSYDRPQSVFMRPYGKAGAGRFWRP